MDTVMSNKEVEIDMVVNHLCLFCIEKQHTNVELWLRSQDDETEDLRIYVLGLNGEAHYTVREELADYLKQYAHLYDDEEPIYSLEDFMYEMGEGVISNWGYGTGGAVSLQVFPNGDYVHEHTDYELIGKSYYKQSKNILLDP